MTEETGLSEHLAAHIAAARTALVPPEVAAKARLHLIDTLAAMVSGRDLAAGRAILGHVRAEGGAPLCSVVGTALLTGPTLAALANGMAAHADETDDSHAPSLTHPGCVVVPAALAAAEAHGRGGADLLRAVIVGYDIGTRMSMALGAGTFADTWHLSSHGWGGPFGAMAAAAALAGLDASRCRHALSYAVQAASGVRCWLRDPDHVQKAYVFAGMPARNGVEAARLAAAGLTGVADAVEGTPGLFAAFASTVNAARATEELGRRHEVMRTTIKKWCVGSPLQAPLDCIETVVREHGLCAADVAAIHVTLPAQRSRVAQSGMPDINMAHALALYLVDGGVTFASLHDRARMADPEVRRVAARISVAPRPGAARGDLAHVTLTTADGRRFHFEPRHVRGQPADPMTEAEVTAKALDLFGMALGAERGRRLLAALRDIDTVTDIRSLRPLWQP